MEPMHNQFFAKDYPDGYVNGIVYFAVGIVCVSLMVSLLAYKYLVPPTVTYQNMDSTPDCDSEEEEDIHDLDDDSDDDDQADHIPKAPPAAVVEKPPVRIWVRSASNPAMQMKEKEKNRSMKSGGVANACGPNAKYQYTRLLQQSKPHYQCSNNRKPDVSSVEREKEAFL